MENSKIDSEALIYWKFLLKLALPIILLSCKAKIIHENKAIDTVVIIAPKDTSQYNWSDNFTNSELRQMCRENKLIINNK